MKKIEAIVRPERLEAVKEALVAQGHAGLTVTEVKGHGIQKGITQQWRGQEYSIDLLPKVMVMAVVHDHEVADVLKAITEAARTGMIGDGKIFVSSLRTSSAAVPARAERGRLTARPRHHERPPDPHAGLLLCTHEGGLSRPPSRSFRSPGGLRTARVAPPKGHPREIVGQASGPSWPHSRILQRLMPDVPFGRAPSSESVLSTHGLPPSGGPTRTRSELKQQLSGNLPLPPRPKPGNPWLSERPHLRCVHRFRRDLLSFDWAIPSSGVPDTRTRCRRVNGFHPPAVGVISRTDAT